MDPRSPFFYTSTFITNEAAGIVPVSSQDLSTVVASMQDACYGTTFDPARCASLSQMVGRMRTQNACLTNQPQGMATSLAASPAASKQVTSLALISALSAIGTNPGSVSCR
jgi:hypothetical protein